MRIEGTLKYSRSTSTNQSGEKQIQNKYGQICQICIFGCIFGRAQYGNSKNIDIDIDIDMVILENIDIDIDIDKKY